jgi:hypothetical protein
MKEGRKQKERQIKAERKEKRGTRKKEKGNERK